MSAEKLAEKIVAQLGLACGLDCTTVATGTVEECLGADAERDLEVWRQAYIAAIPRMRVNLINDQLEHTLRSDWVDVANKALADYRAKREEMGL